MFFIALMADTPATTKLLKLAARRFDAISPAEQKLFDAAADGKDADCTCLPEKTASSEATASCGFAQIRMRLR